MSWLKKIFGGNNQTQKFSVDIPNFSKALVPNEAEQFLEWLHSESLSTDLDELLLRDSNKFQLCLAGQFDYNVRKGGFSQLLYNMQGNYLSEMESMLIEANAVIAKEFYVQAISACLADKVEYQHFLASNYLAPNKLKDNLNNISLAYFSKNTPLIQESSLFLTAGHTRYCSDST